MEQVHRATLKGGEEVAVKVQRAGLKELFDTDLKNLKVCPCLGLASERVGGRVRFPTVVGCRSERRGSKSEHWRDSVMLQEVKSCS